MAVDEQVFDLALVIITEKVKELQEESIKIRQCTSGRCMHYFLHIDYYDISSEIPRRDQSMKSIMANR